jgi:hypothetical protein
MAPPWTLAIVLAVGVLLLLVLLMGRRWVPGTQRVVRRLRCPVRDAEVAVGLVEAVWDMRPLDVESCSVFDPPTAVTCDKRCLHAGGSSPKWQLAARHLY